MTDREKAVNPIPTGFPEVIPYLIVHDGHAAVEFYKKVFNSKERDFVTMPDGKVAHAELEIGESLIMLADEHAEASARSPKTIGATPVFIHVYVEDVDTVFKRALDAGATELRPLENQFYGDRTGTLLDPFGHQWSIATHVEDVSKEELARRFEEMTKSQGS